MVEIPEGTRYNTNTNIVPIKNIKNKPFTEWTNKGKQIQEIRLEEQPDLIECPRRASAVCPVYNNILGCISHRNLGEDWFLLLEIKKTLVDSFIYFCSCGFVSCLEHTI